MLPTILSLGPFHLQTISLFQAVAFLSCGLVFWYRAKEESYHEARVFDGFLLSFIIGWLGGRAGYIVFNWPRFGMDVLKWLNVVHYPGTHLFIALIVASIYLYFYARKQKWNPFEVLDWWAQALTMGLLWLNIGFFLAGIRFGYTTDLPWGIVFPGVFEPRHPIQIYYVLYHLAMYKFLDWLEYNYRTFEWYRSGKKTAQTGFLFVVFIICYSLFSLLMSLLQPPQLMVGEVVLDSVIFLGFTIFGCHLLLVRANRVWFSLRNKQFFAIKR